MNKGLKTRRCPMENALDSLDHALKVVRSHEDDGDGGTDMGKDCTT